MKGSVIFLMPLGPILAGCSGMSYMSSSAGDADGGAAIENAANSPMCGVPVGSAPDLIIITAAGAPITGTPVVLH